MTTTATMTATQILALIGAIAVVYWSARLGLGLFEIHRQMTKQGLYESGPREAGKQEL